MRRTSGIFSASMAVALIGCSSQPAAVAGNTAAFSPRTNYALHCQGCHLPDGSGMIGKVPDMRGVLGTLARLPDGRAYLVRVPGAANSTLSDSQTADVLNWMVRGMDPGASDFVPFDQAEVARYRHLPLNDPKGERDRLLKKTDAGSHAASADLPKNNS